MMSMRDRYYQDTTFHTLVDIMVSHIHDGNFTPSEMREAAMLASILYEELNVRRYPYIEREVEYALRTIRERVKSESNSCNHVWWESVGYDLCSRCGAKRVKR